MGLLLFAPVGAVAGDEECPEDGLRCWIELLETGDAPSILRAAMALGRLGDAEAIPALMKKLGDEDQYVATVAVYALVKIGPPASPVLVEATRSKDAKFRKYAAYALARIGGGDVIKAISPLARDSDKEVRLSAARAFGLLEDKAALFDLVSLLQDRSSAVRLEAIRSLARMPDPKVAGSLVESGLGGLDGRVAMESAALLLKIGPPAAAPVLKKFLNAPPYAKKRMCLVLGEIGAGMTGPERSRIEKALTHASGDPREDMEVRKAACVGLGTLGGEKARAALAAVVKANQDKSKAAELVKTARGALDRMGKKTK